MFFDKRKSLQKGIKDINLDYFLVGKLATKS